MREEEQERLTNRNIARLLTRLKPFNLPDIAQDDIKRAFWFLSNDLKKIADEDRR